jgi:hypothetical protein
MKVKASAYEECVECGDEFPTARRQLGYRVCLFCGEDIARTERKSWTVVQEYTKGCYMFITPAAVSTTLKQTNPKMLRGD